MRGLASRSRAQVLGAATGAVVALAAVTAGYELTRDSAAPAAVAPPRAAAAPLLSEAAFERRSGVRIVRVAVSGGGGLVDLRYQVLDPDAAASIHDAATPPQLVDEGTGVLVRGLLMGHSHKGRLNPAQTYYLVFENPVGLVHRGSRVTVQLGAAGVAHVPVR
jgi:glycerol uptake facilitator-like aquaporin